LHIPSQTTTTQRFGPRPQKRFVNASRFCSGDNGEPADLAGGKVNVSEIEGLKKSIQVCMFDQYGTVVDIQFGLTQAVTPYLRAKGWNGDPASFVTWWRRTHFENSMMMPCFTNSTRRIGRSAAAPLPSSSSALE
jgi:hypothetical protein